MSQFPLLRRQLLRLLALSRNLLLHVPALLLWTRLARRTQENLPVRPVGPGGCLLESQWHSPAQGSAFATLQPRLPVLPSATRLAS